MVAKQPDKTRQTILEAAMREIFRHGFQAASIDQILKGTGVTKGALYYHFPSKRELGYAVVDEVIRGWLLERWLKPLEASDDPISGLGDAVRQVVAEVPDEMIELGCPLNNLVQEMSPIDEGFRLRLHSILTEWRGGIAEQLRRGQADGHVRPDVDANCTAAFLVASFEGISGVAKNAQSRELASSMIEILLQFVETLRPNPALERASAAV